MAIFAGRGACACCKSAVEVYLDRNGLAYYKCGPCGIKLTHSKPAKSRDLLAAIDRHADEDGAPEIQAKAAPAEKKSAPVAAPKPNEIPKKPTFSLFGAKA